MLFQAHGKEPPHRVARQLVEDGPELGVSHRQLQDPGRGVLLCPQAVESKDMHVVLQGSDQRLQSSGS